MNKKNTSFNSKAFKTGSYSALLTVIVILLVVFLNIVFGTLPKTLTQIDISSQKLYTLTSNTEAVIDNLEQDVNIYLISQSGQEDTVTETLLNKYDALSNHIHVKTINPDVYPTFAANYYSGEVTNNDIVVESGERYKYIPIAEIYEQDASDYSYTGELKTVYDGEGEITSAIDYVTKEELPKMYILTGHGEAELSASLTSSIQRANVEIEMLSLATVDSIPEDAALVMLHAPSTDISVLEVQILENYLDKGGKMLVATGISTEGEFKNVSKLLAYMGLQTVDGVVFESDRSLYAYGYPYILIPGMESHDVTDPLIAENYSVLDPLPQGAIRVSNGRELVVRELLVSYDTSFSKPINGTAITTYEKEDGDTDGPFILAASIKEAQSMCHFIWIGSSYITDDTYNAYSSGANMNFFMNCISDLLDQGDSISIRTKDVNTEYLTISESQASMLKIVMIIVIPVIFLLLGVVELIFRRKLR